MEALSTVTLVTAIWGAVTGTAALVWGIWQFVLAGPRIEAEINQGRLEGNGLSYIHGGNVWDEHQAQYPHPIVVIEARNKGRSPVDVTDVSVDLGKVSVGQKPYSLGDSPTLPHRLEPGSNALWLVDLEPVARATAVNVKVMKSDASARARIDLGTGKRVTSANRLTIPHG